MFDEVILLVLHLLVGLPGLARVRLRPFIRGLVVEIPTKISAIVSESWLDISVYKVR
jgi:hypothetical protein